MSRLCLLLGRREWETRIDVGGRGIDPGLGERVGGPHFSGVSA